MKMKGLLIGTVALAAALTVSNAQAASILLQTPQGGYTSNVMYGSVWTTFTGYMTGAHTLTATPDFENLAQLQLYDAVWVDQELGNTLSGGEVTALTSYISAGHRVVMIGENSGWTAWNNSLMAVAGGTVTQDCSWSFGTPLVSNTLTAGVGSVQNVCGSTLNPAGNLQLQFSNGMAGVYTVGAGEVLVIADSNWNDDNYISSANNRLFAQNVVRWIGEPISTVPDPGSSLLLLGMGLAGLRAWKKRQ